MAGLLTPALRQSLTVYPDKIFVEVNFGSYNDFHAWLFTKENFKYIGTMKNWKFPEWLELENK